MLVETVLDDARWGGIPLDDLAQHALCTTLAHLGHDAALFEVSVLACDDRRIRDLNARFRDKDAATNVLSWPTWDLTPDTPGDLPDPPEAGSMEAPEGLGDIALSWETCEREARAQGKTIDDHVTHLIVHSALHLLGYDHQTDEDAGLMEETEVAILAKLGIGDPYAFDETGLSEGIAGVD